MPVLDALSVNATAALLVMLSMCQLVAYVAWFQATEHIENGRATHMSKGLVHREMLTHSLPVDGLPVDVIGVIGRMVRGCGAVMVLECFALAKQPSEFAHRS